MKQIGGLDPDMVIWRYLTLKKFVSLAELRAVWFAKLAIFEDAEEGMTPGISPPRAQASASRYGRVVSRRGEKEPGSAVR